MRIAFLSTFYPFRGGIAQFNANVYRALENENDFDTLKSKSNKEKKIQAFNFTRLYPSLFFPGKTQFVEENDSADKIPSERILDSINPLSYYQTAKAIKAFSPDLLLLDYWHPFFAPSLGMVAKLLKRDKVTVISIMSNVIPHEHKPGDEILTKYFLKHNDAFIVLAESVKNDLISLKNDAKYRIHPHPVYEHFGMKLQKSEARKKLQLSNDKKIVLFFGLIRHYKGLDILIEAFSQLPNDYHLLIVGEIYGDEKEYKELIEKYNLQQKVTLINKYVPDNEVSPYFSAADVCVLPYRSATQSGVIGVAYHFNLPVITTNVGGLKEVIEPFQTGMIIEKAEVNLIKEGILKFFHSNLSEFYSSNIEKFKLQYNWKSFVNEIAKLFKELNNS
ncbi:MAG: glycosyltransferase [Candidatus Kapaibacteriota bacterium]